MVLDHRRSHVGAIAFLIARVGSIAFSSQHKYLDQKMYKDDFLTDHTYNHLKKIPFKNTILAISFPMPLSRSANVNLRLHGGTEVVTLR